LSNIVAFHHPCQLRAANALHPDYGDGGDVTLNCAAGHNAVGVAINNFFSDGISVSGFFRFHYNLIQTGSPGYVDINDQCTNQGGGGGNRACVMADVASGGNGNLIAYTDVHWWDFSGGATIVRQSDNYNFFGSPPYNYSQCL